MAKTEADDRKPADQQQPGKPSWLQVIGSALAAGFGIQNRQNRQRDFQQGNHRAFVIAGIVLTLAFIGAIYAVVSLVLKNTS